MKSDRTRRGKTFTKSHLMLDLIADLENIGNSEVEEEEGEGYDELEEKKEEKSPEELQEHYSKIKTTEVCILPILYNRSLNIFCVDVRGLPTTRELYLRRHLRTGGHSAASL